MVGLLWSSTRNLAPPADEGYGKQEHPKAPPMLQRNAFVKWWSQFDAAMVHPEKVRNWFKEHPKFTKPFDHEESVFLNQKAQIAATLAGAQSKETLARHLQQIMQMIDEDKNTKTILLPQKNHQVITIKMKTIALESI
ncbi:uncharacterized protein DS421_1g18410 [Arachis hypogaea]|nr:uncharacterized protein DS421_1g18410 [Arachis hypogaea]